MQIDIKNLDRHIEAGTLIKGTWGDVRERAILMSAVVAGARSWEDCEAQGWPLWLAQACITLFNGLPDDIGIKRGREMIQAIKAADERGIDWDQAFKDFRRDSVLPIALESIPDGTGPWPTECRRVVQGCIDAGGVVAEAAEVAEAAWAAGADRSARAAEAAGDSWAAGTAWAARAAEMARAPGELGVRAAACHRMALSLIRVVSGREE